jgi:hypothetical protein
MLWLPGNSSSALLISKGLYWKYCTFWLLFAGVKNTGRRLTSGGSNSQNSVTMKQSAKCPKTLCATSLIEYIFSLSHSSNLQTIKFHTFPIHFPMLKYGLWPWVELPQDSALKVNFYYLITYDFEKTESHGPWT